MERLVNKSLEDLRLEDLRLRDKLSGSLEDDAVFEELRSEMERELRRLGGTDEGEEKARILASLEALYNRLAKTTRARLSDEFMALSLEKEARELDIAETKKVKVLEFPKAS